MPSWPTATSWPSATSWPGATSWPAGTSWPIGFTGNFFNLFPAGSVLQLVQSDLGVTYGGTPLATTGNTSTTVITQTGAPTAGVIPIWAKATNSAAVGAGATFNIYYDGAGATPAMFGVTPAVGSPVVLTGAGTGASYTWSAGTGVTNDSWKAVCSAWADQSGNGVDCAQPTLGKQPLITAGLNGVAALAGDGASIIFPFTLALPAPATTPTFYWGVWRMNAVNGSQNSTIIGDTAGTGLLLINAVGTFPTRQYNGSLANANANTTAGLWGRQEAYFSASAADYNKFGSVSQGGVSAGNGTATAGRFFFGGQISANYCNAELLAWAQTNSLPTAAQRATLSAAATAKYGAGVQT